MAITKKQKNRVLMLKLFENFLSNFRDDGSLMECMNTVSMEWGENENIVRAMIENLQGEVAPLTDKDVIRNKNTKDVMANFIGYTLEFFNSTVEMVRAEQENDRENEERDRQIEEENSTYRTVIVDGVEYKLVPVEK